MATALEFARVVTACALAGLVAGLALLLLAWAIEGLRVAFRGREALPELPPREEPLDPGAGRKVIARIGPRSVRPS